MRKLGCTPPHVIGFEASCLPLCGLPLKGPTILETTVWATTNFDTVLNASGLGYSDGTDGLSDVPKELRRSAFGAATFEVGIADGVPKATNLQ